MNFNEFLFTQLYVKYIEGRTYRVVFYDRVYRDAKDNYAKYINSGYYPTDEQAKDWIMLRDSISDYLLHEVRIINY